MINKIVAINKALLKDPRLTAAKIKVKFHLVASTETILRALHKLGWRKVPTKYCQVVKPYNRLKRFIFACQAKIEDDKMEDVTDVDECRVEMRWYTAKTWQKPSQTLLRAAGGKVGKVKHNIKVNLFGGISRKGLTPLVIFEKLMFSDDFQKILSIAVLPHLREKFPYGHRFFMDNDPKHTSRSTARFMILNNINHFPTPPESPDLMPIEMVWNDLKFYLTNNCSLKSKRSLLFHIRQFWKLKMNDLEYCNAKFGHLPKVIDHIIAVCGKASGM